MDKVVGVNFQGNRTVYLVTQNVSNLAKLDDSAKLVLFQVYIVSLKKKAAQTAYNVDPVLQITERLHAAGNKPFPLCSFPKQVIHVLHTQCCVA